MITEIMGFLILLGAAIVLIVRWQSRKDQQPAEMQQDMQYSTYQLKQELERTGNEITSRMEQHVIRLEQLIQEADHRKSILDGRIAELRELVRLGDEQMDALHTLRSEIVEARQLKQKLTEVGRQASAMLQTQSIPMERVDAQNFSDVLQQSMAEEEETQETPAYSVGLTDSAYMPQFPVTEDDERQLQGMSSPQNAAHPETSADERAIPSTGTERAEHPQEENSEQAAGADPAKVRALLLSGWSVEDTARETGMGKGAVELMREMLRHRLGDETSVG